VSGRRWPWAAVLAAALGLPSCAGRAAQPAPRVPQQQPNIILILTDDLDLTPVPHMPWLRSQLTARGVSFKNAFVTDSVCAPSRVSILTGQYVHGHGIIDNPPPKGGFRRWYRDGGEASTVATWLRDAGYRTALIGKYVNYYPQASNVHYVPPGWSDWNALFFQESYYQFKMNRNGRIVDYGTTASDYQTDVLHQQALEFLETTRPGEPFFLHLSYYAPHAPPVPADRHQALFPELEAPRPDSFDEEDVSDKPAWVQAQPRLDDEKIAGIDEWYRNRVRMLQAVDESIAGIVRRLEERGQIDDTWIFFTSDNGFQQGAHRMDHGKGDAYDESIRVPLIVRGPGVPRNVRMDHFALNIDLAPTFAELAGAQVPDFVDGRSLVPLLGSDPLPLDEWRSDFLVEHWGPPDGGLPEYAALRSQKNLYVEYANGERELYDMAADPAQLASLHATAAPTLIEWLSARLAALKECRGESCRVEPAPLEAPATPGGDAAKPPPAKTPASGPTPRAGTGDGR